MKEAEKPANVASENRAVNAKRELRLYRSGPLRFGLFSEEVDEVTDWRQPTRLPLAPDAVLGIICVQARMVTVLDPLKLLSEFGEAKVSPARIAVLAGDEQLGLAVEVEEGTLDIASAEIKLEGENQPVLGTVRVQEQVIRILEPHRLFAAAIHGRQRRRRS